jgi:hypothetical protein
MADIVNDIPMNSLSANVGHQFISVASFPWMDPVNGARYQECIIDIVLQTKVTLEDTLLYCLDLLVNICLLDGRATQASYAGGGNQTGISFSHHRATIQT